MKNESDPNMYSLDSFMPKLDAADAGQTERSTEEEPSLQEQMTSLANEASQLKKELLDQDNKPGPERVLEIREAFQRIQNERQEFRDAFCSVSGVVKIRTCINYLTDKLDEASKKRDNLREQYERYLDRQQQGIFSKEDRNIAQNFFNREFENLNHEWQSLNYIKTLLEGGYKGISLEKEPIFSFKSIF